jgi:hypothetical protein
MVKIWILSLFFKIFVGVSAPTVNYIDLPMLTVRNLLACPNPNHAHCFDF